MGDDVAFFVVECEGDEFGLGWGAGFCFCFLLGGGGLVGGWGGRRNCQLGLRLLVSGEDGQGWQKGGKDEGRVGRELGREVEV